MTIDMLDPTTLPMGLTSTFTRAPRPSSLRGLRLGVLDNGKPNSGAFLDALATMLQPRVGLGSVTTVRKPAIGRLAPPELRERLRDTADIVLTGVGDCSGCATCTVQDALDLEAAGIPTAVVCTDEFLDLVRRHAVRAGATDQRFVTLEHPFGSRSPEALASMASSARDGVIAWLTGEMPNADVAVHAASAEIQARSGDAPGGEVTCLC